MKNVQTRHIEGLCRETGGVMKTVITLPLLPRDGAFSLTGQVIGTDEVGPRNVANFFPQIFGACNDGVVLHSDNLPLVTTGPSAELTVTGQQLEIRVKGILDRTFLWAWSLDLLVLSLG